MPNLWSVRTRLTEMGSAFLELFGLGAQQIELILSLLAHGLAQPIGWAGVWC